MSSLLLLTLVALSLVESGLSRQLPVSPNFPPDDLKNLNLLLQQFQQVDDSQPTAYFKQLPWPLPYAFAIEGTKQSRHITPGQIECQWLVGQQFRSNMKITFNSHHIILLVSPEAFGFEVDAPPAQQESVVNLSSERDSPYEPKPKRNSKNYSACHFKICGLGRKRSRIPNRIARSVLPRASKNI